MQHPVFLLIHGAAGGVGLLAVQLAVARGATVIGTASPARHDQLRKYGATPVAYGAGLADRVRAIGPVDAALDLVGTADLALVPAARSVAWTLASDWPHPSFGGRFLPVTREVRHDGFEARWAVTALASSATQRVEEPGEKKPAGEKKPELWALDTLAVTFTDPVNPYVLADRAIKYGLLFVALTFAAVALTETLAGQRVRRVHPVQYALVGLALALFFLLLLALSEHLPFATAYAGAAAACVLLLGTYGRHLLGSVRAGRLFGAGMALLYGLLYLLLLREQTALLVGALGLFAALATVMLLTRRLDWYRIGAPAAPMSGEATGRDGRLEST